MLGRVILKRGAKAEGESPFWISFSDLMTALMTLFLVVMAVTLVAVTKNLTAEEEAKIQREKDIRGVMAQIKRDSAQKNVNVDESTYRIDLGDVVRFESGDYSIKPDAARFLRDYIPVLLNAKSTPEGQRWMRRVVVEGFTDQDGTYLYNLGLSLNRSRSVVCMLFARPATGERILTASQLRQVQDLFLVGGYSFNSIRQDKAASRRVELKIEFWGVDEKGPPANALTNTKEFGQC
ncbi:flagellar motor protein MotB [Cupriavidus sp. 2MCAB6]|uniref:OmpA/MotB family protein n=1 Tax=Cupriavidus sp. 2MCAB6 TaxID=3232981 RepID=UPI003F90C15F